MTLKSGKSRRPQTRNRRRGGTLVEAAIVLSLITMFSMGGVQYGYAFYLKHALQQAASAGVRVAVMPGSLDSQVQTAVTNQLAAAGFGSLSPTITTNPSTVVGVTQGTYITVTVSASWTHVGINPLPSYLGGFASNRNFTAAAEMMHE